MKESGNHLIPMDGFFEPKGPKSHKNRPQYFIRFSDRRPFFVAGLWTKKVEGADLDSFALITTDPTIKLRRSMTACLRSSSRKPTSFGCRTRRTLEPYSRR